MHDKYFETRTFDNIFFPVTPRNFNVVSSLIGAKGFIKSKALSHYGVEK
jgi:hypothetical protein